MEQLPTILAAATLDELSILLVAIFGAFGTILLGFYKYADTREKDVSRSRDNQTAAFEKTIHKLSLSLDANVRAHQDVAKAVTKQAEEAEARNGHLGDQSRQIAMIVNRNHNELMDAVDKSKISKQTIKNQTVEHQEIKE